MRIEIEGVPEVLAVLRLELAQILRDVAATEADSRVAERLRAIAAAYECGTRP